MARQSSAQRWLWGRLLGGDDLLSIISDIQWEMTRWGVRRRRIDNLLTLIDVKAEIDYVRTL